MSGFQMSRRGLLIGAAALSACAPAKPPAGGPVTLRVGVYRGGVQVLLAAAGLADTPYRIVPSEFASGNLITEAINARALDTGSMSEIPPIFVAGAGEQQLRLVSVQKADVNSQVVLVPKGSAIRSGADLKGKRVGYMRATTSHYILLKLLGEHGQTFKDITPVALSPQDGLAAFGQGALDAWVIYGVQGSLARGTLGARVLTTGLGRLSGNYVHAASRDALADPGKRAAIVDYLQRINRAWAWSSQHPGAYAAALSAATGVPAAIYLQQHRERSGPTFLAPVDAAAIASQQAVADAFAQAGVIPARVDVSALWTDTLNADIAASAGARLP